MKPTANPLGFFMFSLILSLSIAFPAPFVRAESVRPAVWAGRFYKADPSGLANDIDRLTRKAQKTRLQIPKDKTLLDQLAQDAQAQRQAGYGYFGLDDLVGEFKPDVYLGIEDI